MSSAVAGVRFETARFVTGEPSYTVHRATVLAIFKRDPRLPAVGERVTLFENACQFCTDHGTLPPWDTRMPIPSGSHRIVFLFWDDEHGGFRIVNALF